MQWESNLCCVACGHTHFMLYYYHIMYASIYQRCESISGDCTCQPGTSGKQCNSCLPQHWNFTTEGCQSCECALDGAVGCSVETGICQCLQGVTGERCDRCADRWVLIPSTGCEACDNCVHTLLDDTDSIQFDIANASESLRIINIGFEARKRLELLNETIPFIQVSIFYHLLYNMFPLIFQYLILQCSSKLH